MRNLIDSAFAFQERALQVQGYRQQVLASNIANADTPNYKARDIDFAKALRQAQGGREMGMTRTSPMHLDVGGSGPLAGVRPQYRSAVQPSIDGNTVDTNIEQAQFADNALRYMATVRFIDGKLQTAKLALQGN